MIDAIHRKSISELRNRHFGSDVWVIGAGPSMDHVDPAFFRGKTVIGVNQVFRRFPCTYTVRKDALFAEEAARSGVPLIMAMHDQGDLSRRYNSVHAPAFFFDHKDKAGPALDVIRLDSDQLVVSLSTITTAMHFAAYLGAANVIVCGHDGGSLDGEINYRGYNDSRSLPDGDAYRKWVTEIMPETIQVRDRLQQVFGCRIYSLNPFQGFALEGHDFQP